MKSIIISIFVCVFVFASGLSAFGQEWTAEQKEVWATIEAVWKAIEKGDVESAMARRHDNYRGLYSGRPTPTNKDQARKGTERWLSGDFRLTAFELKPIEISITDNVAVVYYWNKWEAYNFTKHKNRTMEILIKQNNKWVTIGLMGASCAKPEKCPSGF